MAGTRTAPDVTGTVTAKRLSVSWIDSSADKRTDSYFIPAAATQAQIEAALDAWQAESGASLYKVSVHNEWGTDASADFGNATTVDNKANEIFANVILGFQTGDPEKKPKNVLIPAPIESMFVVDAGTGLVSDVLDPTQTELGTLETALLAMFGSGWDLRFGRYASRQEVNERTPL